MGLVSAPEKVNVVSYFIRSTLESIDVNFIVWSSRVPSVVESIMAEIPGSSLGELEDVAAEVDSHQPRNLKEGTGELNSRQR